MIIHNPEVETTLIIEVDLVNKTSIHLIIIEEIKALTILDIPLTNLLLHIIEIYIILIKTRHSFFLPLLAFKNEKLY